MTISAYSQVKYTKIYLRDTTLISPFPMLLFGGDIDIQHRERLITLDGWIHFQVRHVSFPAAAAAPVCLQTWLRGPKNKTLRATVSATLNVLISFNLCSPLKAPVRIGVIFKHLRKLMDSLLEKKLENPRMSLEGILSLFHSVDMFALNKNLLTLIYR